MKPARLPFNVKQIIVDHAFNADKELRFPVEAFEALSNSGITGISLPIQAMDFNGENYTELLHLLKEVGSADLAVGRIYEGHINALELIQRFGNIQQKDKWLAEAAAGKIFGVWNTEGADGVLIRGNEEWHLEGSKLFCSGAGQIDCPIVTGKRDNGGWQMLVLSKESFMNGIDESFWDPPGMRASVSFKVNFNGVRISADDMLGEPDRYYEQPFFSGGAIRFCAVQLGGASEVFEETLSFLIRANRTDDYAQKTRIANMTVLIQEGMNWIAQAGKVADQVHQRRLADDVLVATANMMRKATENIAEEIMQISEKCVGARGMMKPGRLERLHRDLHFYLRQPAPDAALIAIADYIIEAKKRSDDIWY